MAYALRSPEDEMTRYEEMYWIEAIEAFEACVKFDVEQFAKSIAACYIDEYEPAEKIFDDMGLTMKHALALTNTKAFWDFHNEEEE